MPGYQNPSAFVDTNLHPRGRRLHPGNLPILGGLTLRVPAAKSVARYGRSPGLNMVVRHDLREFQIIDSKVGFSRARYPPQEVYDLRNGNPICILH
jgi:hypothetical protein